MLEKYEPKATEASYNVSKDYNKLYDLLVKEKLTLTCFVKYGEGEYSDRDIAIIRIYPEATRFQISARGISYEYFVEISEGIEPFIKMCNKLELSYIPPKILSKIDFIVSIANNRIETKFKKTKRNGEIEIIPLTNILEDKKLELKMFALLDIPYNIQKIKEKYKSELDEVRNNELLYEYVFPIINNDLIIYLSFEFLMRLLDGVIDE